MIRTSLITMAATRLAKLNPNTKIPGPPTSDARAPPRSASPFAEMDSKKDLKSAMTGSLTARDAETTVLVLFLDISAQSLEN